MTSFPHPFQQVRFFGEVLAALWPRNAAGGNSSVVNMIDKLI